MSGMLAPIGIVSGPMSEQYGLPVTEITARFSWLTVGIFVGAVLALGALNWSRTKTLMLLVYALIAASLLSLLVDDSLGLVTLRLGLIGVCCGVGLPAAALVLSRSYSGERRASMLVITDGFFSVAGVVCSALAVFLLARNSHWSGVYLFVAVMALCLVAVAAVSKFPEAEDFSEPDVLPAAWPTSAWLCIAALATYTLAQNAILMWLPQYAQSQMGVDPESAGNLVGRFWSGMFVAQIFVAWWVFKIGVTRLLWLAGGCTLLFSLPLWLATDRGLLAPLVALWGFANLGLLKVVVSYATQFTAIASPRLVSSLLLGATTGTAVSPWVSSQLVTATDAGGALRFGSLCYLVMFVLLGLAATKQGFRVGR
jgi:TsgA-like MFS transporter